MKLGVAMEALRQFQPPRGWAGDVFLLPPSAIEELYDAVIARRLHRCLELGTGFGATACVIAAAIDELGSGEVVTVDKVFHRPVNVRTLLEHLGLCADLVRTVTEPLGYNWWLASYLAKGPQKGLPFDLCFLDGAHEFETDALAFALARNVLRRGGVFVFDDLNFHLRQVPSWRQDFGNRSDRELDAEQVRMIWDLLVVKDPAFHNLRISCGGRVGWAEKKRLLMFDRRGAAV